MRVSSPFKFGFKNSVLLLYKCGDLNYFFQYYIYYIWNLKLESAFCVCVAEPYLLIFLCNLSMDSPPYHSRNVYHIPQGVGLMLMLFLDRILDAWWPEIISNVVFVWYYMLRETIYVQDVRTALDRSSVVASLRLHIESTHVIINSIIIIITMTISANSIRVFKCLH